MSEGLRLLEGKAIEAFHLDTVGLDLTLAFSGGLRLKIFCDALTDFYQACNYTLGTQEGHYISGIRSILGWEEIHT